MAGDVFVDTSGWYAVIDRRDQHHRRAQEMIRRSLRQGRRLVTTDYVVDEACTLTGARAGALAATRLLDLLRDTRAVDWEWIGSERFARAEARFRKQADQAFSFTDCTSFEVMRERSLQTALTSDAHFRIAGFDPLLVLKA
jgi:predicted nucleic acid-binding protein